MPVAQQNLVAYGKVLADGQNPLGSYGLKDGDFVVVMIKKAKPAPKAKVEEPVPVPKVEEKPVEVQPTVVAEKEGDWEDVNDKPSTVPA
jgi:hypothetical protein